MRSISNEDANLLFEASLSNREYERQLKENAGKEIMKLAGLQRFKSLPYPTIINILLNIGKWLQIAQAIYKIIVEVSDRLKKQTIASK